MPSKEQFIAHFKEAGLTITDVVKGDPDEVQITFKLAAGWGWDDLGIGWAGLTGSDMDAT